MPASVTHVTVGTSPFTDLGRDTGEIAVLNSSDTATVYVKLGAAGTVKGANCYRIPPGSRRKIKLTTDGNTVVHHISTAATTDVENRGGLMTSELERLGPGPGSPGGGAVDSVDGQTGAVDLTNSYQAKDADLIAIAGLSASNDDFVQRKSGAWSSRTVAQVKTDRGITDEDFQDLIGAMVSGNTETNITSSSRTSDRTC
jgi:hypothetical protein